MSTQKDTKTADQTKGGRLQKVERPDINERNQVLDAVKAKIAELDKKLKAVFEEIDQNSGGRKEFMSKRNEMRQKLDEFSEIINAREVEKQRIIDLLRRENSKKRDAQDEQKKQQNKLGLKSPAEIDQKVAQMEHQMMVSVMTLKEEKDIIQKIKELKIAKSQFSSATTSASGNDNSSKLEAQLQIVKQEIKEAKDAKREQQKHLSDLQNARSQVDDGNSEMYTERDRIRRLIDAEYNKKKAILEDFKMKMGAFYEHQAETKAARDDKRRADNLAWAADQARNKAKVMTEEEDSHPHMDSMLLLEQTIKYCENLVNPSKKGGSAEAQDAKEVAHDNPEGSEVLLTKKQREEAANAGYKGRGTKKDRMKNKTKEVGKEVNMDARIKHDLATIESFRKCKVDIPITIKDVPAIIETLTAELDQYKKKVDEWKASHDERAAKRKTEMAEHLAKAKELDAQAAEAREAIKARERGEAEEAAKEE